MSAFVIGNYTVHDIDKYMAYVHTVRSTIEAFNGRTLFADHDHFPQEGAPMQVVVGVEFETKEKALEWYNSSLYQTIIHLRKESVDGWVTICTSLPKQGGI